MSILDNIILCGMLVSRNKKQIKAKAKEMLSSVGLTERSYSKLPSQLSGGEAQRAAIIRALINDPEIVFANEPTGALNSNNSDLVLDVLTKINEQGQSIVMVTHDMKSARRAN